MKIAYYALHYGAEYLPWSIRSVQDAVDEIHVLYTPVPSYGHGGKEACPETEAVLREAAHRFAKKPIHWHTGRWFDEGAHRSAALHIASARGAKQVLVVDADEIWAPESAACALEAAARANRAGRWMARFCNFWRSFGYVVKDHFTPIRVVDLRHALQIDASLSPEEQPEPVYHFGYAQSLAIMRYKWTCHGHQAELRPGWREKFESWRPETGGTDLHPCVNFLWDKAHETPPEVAARLVVLLHDHPNLGRDLIA